MPDELGTKDVLEQVDARLGNVEQDIRDLRSEVSAGFERINRDVSGLRAEMGQMEGSLRAEMGQMEGSLRSEMNLRFESQTRWLVGLMLGSWLTIVASIWLKT